MSSGHGLSGGGGWFGVGDDMRLQPRLDPMVPRQERGTGHETQVQGSDGELGDGSDTTRIEIVFRDLALVDEVDEIP
jgi:hypothetical protein